MAETVVALPPRSSTDGMIPRFRKTDLLWLFALPIYLIVGTLHHEGSHALAAILTGATIERFVFWPVIESGRLYWGYVAFSGPSRWEILAAPYVCDLALYAAVFVVCMRVDFRRRWLWINVVIIGLLSPLLDSAYNYGKYLVGVGGPGDVAGLCSVVPACWVHGCFAVTLGAYAAGLIWLLGLRPRSSRSA